MSTRFWVSANGIAQEVIIRDIQQYLGPDALVRPGKGVDDYEEQDGYWVTAHRALTSKMIQRLKADSHLQVQKTEAREPYPCHELASESLSTDQQNPRHDYASTPRFYTSYNGRHCLPFQRPRSKQDTPPDGSQIHSAQPTQQLHENNAPDIPLSFPGIQSKLSDRTRVAEVQKDEEETVEPPRKKRRTSRKKALRNLKVKPLPRGMRRRAVNV